MGIKVILLMLCALPAFGQLGLRSPFFTAAEIRPLAVACATPAAPTNIGLDYVSDVPFIDVTWTDPLNADGIQIWHSIDGAAYTYYDQADTGSEFYIGASDQKSDGHVYIYKIRATNTCGTFSAFSSTITNDIFVDAVEYWRMDEAAGSARTAIIDTDGLGSLTEQGGNVTQTTGKNNNAAAFTSAAGRSLKSTTAGGCGIPFSGDFSISLWLYVTALPIIIDTTILIREASSDIRLNLTAAGDVTWTAAGDVPEVSGALGALSAWHFVVVKFRSAGQSTQIYVDGVALGADSGCGAGPSGDDFLYVCPPFGGLLTLNGSIDEICIFPRELSQAEITSLYGGGTGRFK